MTSPDFPFKGMEPLELKCILPFALPMVTLSHKMLTEESTFTPSMAHISRAERFTTSPMTAYSHRRLLPTAPANTLPVVTPILLRMGLLSGMDRSFLWIDMAHCVAFRVRG